MSDDDWIKRRIAEATADLPLITQPALAQIEELMRGHLSKGELSKGELARIANELIAGMAAVPPEAEAKR